MRQRANKLFMLRLKTNKTYLVVVLFRTSSGVENTSTVIHNNIRATNMIIFYKIKLLINLDIFHSHIPVVFNQGRYEALNDVLQSKYLYTCIIVGENEYFTTMLFLLSNLLNFTASMSAS